MRDPVLAAAAARVLVHRDGRRWRVGGESRLGVAADEGEGGGGRRAAGDEREPAAPAEWRRGRGHGGDVVVGGRSRRCRRGARGASPSSLDGGRATDNAT